MAHLGSYCLCHLVLCLKFEGWSSTNNSPSRDWGKIVETKTKPLCFISSLFHVQKILYILYITQLHLEVWTKKMNRPLPLLLPRPQIILMPLQPPFLQYRSIIMHHSKVTALPSLYRPHLNHTQSMWPTCLHLLMTLVLILCLQSIRWWSRVVKYGMCLVRSLVLMHLIGTIRTVDVSGGGRTMQKMMFWMKGTKNTATSSQEGLEGRQSFPLDVTR